MSGIIGSTGVRSGIIGIAQNPSSPAFSATPIAQSNVTGDGTAYSIIGSGVWTEIFDRNSNLSDGTFTAPVTGIYNLNVNIAIVGAGSSNTNILFYIVTSNREYIYNIDPSDIVQSSLGGFTVNYSVLADMDASDTAFLKVTVSGGSKYIDTTASYSNGAWSGHLVV